MFLLLTILYLITSYFSSQTLASSGCNSSSPWPFDSSNHYNVTLGNRSFLVHIPAAYDASTAHAAVLSFHGFGGNDTEQEIISQFSLKGLTINGKGIVAVYPDGAYGGGKGTGRSIGRAWQGAPYAKPGVDDIVFVLDIITALNENLCIDQSRIYAAGKSNGGGFTNLLACTSSTATLIAAFAPVSAALYPETDPLSNCTPGRPIPLVNFHGLADDVIPFGGQNASASGNTAYALPNITQYREAWAQRDGCASAVPSSTADPYTNTALDVWDCAPGAAVVEGYTIADLGHSWPTTAGLDYSGSHSKAAFNATPEVIVPFFELHALGL